MKFVTHPTILAIPVQKTVFMNKVSLIKKGAKLFEYTRRIIRVNVIRPKIGVENKVVGGIAELLFDAR
jgi:hypothetical protein